MPYFTLWDSFYASESRLRQYQSSKKKERYEATARSEGPAVLEARPIVVPQFDPSALMMKPTTFKTSVLAAGPSITLSVMEEDISDDALMKERERLKEKREKYARDMARIAELQRTDPVKAERERERLNRQDRKREDRPSGGEEERKIAKKSKSSKEAKSADAHIQDLKQHMAEAVMKGLKPFLKSGQIADKESFKHLSRKLCKELVGKERAKHDAPRWHVKIGPAAEKYATAYMLKLQQKGVPYSMAGKN